MGLFNWVNWVISLILWVPVIIAINYAVDAIGSRDVQQASSYSQHNTVTQ